LGENNYLDAFEILLRELENFSPDLIEKKRIIIGTKTDLEGTKDRLDELQKKYPDEKAVGISVFSAEGIPELVKVFVSLVSENRSAE